MPDRLVLVRGQIRSSMPALSSGTVCLTYSTDGSELQGTRSQNAAADAGTSKSTGAGNYRGDAARSSDWFALGGELEIIAHLPGRDVRIRQFKEQQDSSREGEKWLELFFLTQFANDSSAPFSASSAQGLRFFRHSQLETSFAGRDNHRVPSRMLAFVKHCAKRFPRKPALSRMVSSFRTGVSFSHASREA